MIGRRRLFQGTVAVAVAAPVAIASKALAVPMTASECVWRQGLHATTFNVGELSQPLMVTPSLAKILDQIHIKELLRPMPRNWYAVSGPLPITTVMELQQCEAPNATPR